MTLTPQQVTNLKNAVFYSQQDPGRVVKLLTEIFGADEL